MLQDEGVARPPMEVEKFVGVSLRGLGELGFPVLVQVVVLFLVPALDALAVSYREWGASWDALIAVS